MSTIAFIFARGGSKGLPRKNIMELDGKPLLRHSIDVAKEIDEIEDIYVSTDDEEIASIARSARVNVINRPSELAKDDSPEIYSWKHAIQSVNSRENICSKFVSIPTTAPLRKASDIKACMDLFDESTDVVITATESARSPYFNMITIDDNDDAKLFTSESDTFSRRQDVPKTFDVTTVCYVSRPEFILSCTNIFEGKVKAVKIPKERSIDIDDKLDFLVAEMVLKSGL
ncbi:MAG: acylneuraminate cytidylyltransferase family protein [Gammaproteobacteria bacterium]|nr:acylneuraminate cytidylyltransferase family protein [Gammaproteobacteria bacterium]